MIKKVFMKPTMRDMRSDESGIKRVIEAYVKFLPQFGFEVVDDVNKSFDVSASHAGTFIGADVVHTHGLYWTADYQSESWEIHVNRDVILSIRHAREVTVPSAWVAETFQRDMRFTPHIIPHGIETEKYQNLEQSDGYVLWNKNRDADVCSPYPVGWLASRFPKINFVSTFRPADYFANNLKVTGLMKHTDMVLTLQKAGVYLATTKETFGIGILEALACGIPVLGFAAGGILEMIEHKMNGYLAEPNNLEDLADGLDYCIKNRKKLSRECLETAKRFTWEKAVEKVAKVYDLAMRPDPPTVSVVIPTHNYGTEERLGRAIRSVLDQTVECDITVVDDGSNDGGATRRLVEAYQIQNNRIRYIWQENQGVAVARNRGIAAIPSKYVCCLDADDAIEPEFIATCVAELEKDRGLGIAYTGLKYIKPNGETGLSRWPEQYDFDKQLKRHNQVPTCCVFRRVIWERLGGYDSRYAPRGAGSEDAEFWLRAGAYGWSAKKVTDAGMFVYSWMSGHVTSDRNYKEVDWTAWHPWTKDGQHPFASVATPKNEISHLVRQYDQPVVSVIIPVGEGHEREFLNVLDSLDAQTFRRWEAIVVLNGAKFKKIDKPEDDILPDSFEAIKRAYPFVRFITCKKSGAGAARNEGVYHARAKLLLFVDADDWLYPEAIEKMVTLYVNTGLIVYTDYVGKAYLDKKDAIKLGERLLEYNDATQEAVIKHYSAEYDCDRAVRQPDEENKDTYIWCLITSLIEKKWHDEIGGFDENMESWEDWDYWIRMARAGKCFVRLPEDLVVYRFYTGSRRETGLHSHQSLLEYLIQKKESTNAMPCNCGGRTTSTAQTPVMRVVQQVSRMEKNIMDGDNLILVDYLPEGAGQSKVVGQRTGTFYGYRDRGERFYVHKDDIAVRPDIFKPVAVEKPKPVAIEKPKPVEKPKPAEPEFDAQTIPGVNDTIAESIDKLNIVSYKGVYELGIDGLKNLNGCGPSRAAAIYKWLDEQHKNGEW